MKNSFQVEAHTVLHFKQGVQEQIMGSAEQCHPSG